MRLTTFFKLKFLLNFVFMCFFIAAFACIYFGNNGYVIEDKVILSTYAFGAILLGQTITNVFLQSLPIYDDTKRIIPQHEEERDERH